MWNKENSIAYENYAIRLSSLYEYTRKPEDFIQADLEFRRLFKSENFRDEDKRNYGCIHHFMMNYCKDKAIQLLDEIINNKESVEDEVYYRTKGQKIALLSDIGQYDKAHAIWNEIAEALDKEGLEYEAHHARDNAKRCNR